MQLSKKIKDVIEESYIWEKFVFCNFSHIVFDFIKNNNLESRIGNCRQLTTTVSKKLFELWIINDYIEAKSKHIALLLDIEEKIYFLDPLMWQKRLINIYWWKSDSIEPWARLFWRIEWNNWVFTKCFLKWERIQIFTLPEAMEVQNSNFVPCSIRENNNIPKENKIIFYDKNYAKNSIKHLWNLEKFELTILNTNLQVQKILLSAKEFNKFEEHLLLPSNILYYLFCLLHERIRS